MAPPNRGREPSIDRSKEYEDFMKSLTEFHEKRGTTLEAEPKVGNKHVDLKKLYDIVTSRGGYDTVSVEKLMWRKLGQEFNLGSSNLPALAFNLKTAYYKNLAAYEIKYHHGKEPPPKEILEEISARGADILNRTVENFQPRASREAGGLGNGNDDSDGSGEEEHKTPKADKMEVEDPGSGGRVTRGLRQAPPQRVLFQPDVSSSRQTRNTAMMNSPQPATSQTMSSYSNPNSLSFNVANYEPRPQLPLTLRPVPTPRGNPEFFKMKQQKERDHLLGTKPTDKGLILPGTSYPGPNIYLRCLNALRSAIPEEQDYALHHLVKISHERGDKYRFESFVGLAEGLIQKLLDVGSIFYYIKWEISYSDDDSRQLIHVLDGNYGTFDILEKISLLEMRESRDDMMSEELDQELVRINEAALTMRNMCLLEDNARYISEIPSIRDWICIALHLPDDEMVVELKHYALEIAEQITKYFSLETEDPLYISLCEELDSEDRGMILTSLRAITRISMNLEENNRLKGVPLSAVDKMCTWLMIDDYELVTSCLDFLYQFTAVPDNVDLLWDDRVEGLVNNLVRMLQFKARRHVLAERKIKKVELREPASETFLELPDALFDQLNRIPEPERSTVWLRSSFEEDPDNEITQIALWQAYQNRFTNLARPELNPLPAADFIKNISNTFNAQAQVIQVPTPKFIIRGIRPRKVPLGVNGEEWLTCKWSGCNSFAETGQDLWKHVLSAHLNATEPYDFTLPGRCEWEGCKKKPANLWETGMHLKMHIPKNIPKVDKVEEGKVFYDTAIDERGEASGIPLTATLILRNLARNGKDTRVFGPVMPQIWWVMAHNRALNSVLMDFIMAIKDTMEE